MTRPERTAEEIAKDLSEKVVRKIQNDRGVSSGWDLVFQDEIEGMFLAAIRDAKRQTWEEAANLVMARGREIDDPDLDRMNGALDELDYVYAALRAKKLVEGK